MNENNLNAELNEEVVQPQDDNGAEITEVMQEEITEPSKSIEEMSDEEFESYIDTAQESYDDSQNDKNTGDAVPADEGNTKPFKVFNTQEEYQGEFDRIIGERLKKSRESMETLEGLKQHALNFYDTYDGDTALRQLVEDLQQQNAEKHGVSVEEYERQMRDSIDAQKYRIEQNRRIYEQQRIADIQRNWESEAAELKKIVPSFDFAKAMMNNTFYDNIVEGQSVSNAYLAANQKSPVTVSKTRRSIQQNGNMTGVSAGTVGANPASMSDADFMRYIERIKR